MGTVELPSLEELVRKQREDMEFMLCSEEDIEEEISLLKSEYDMYQSFVQMFEGGMAPKDIAVDLDVERGMLISYTRGNLPSHIRLVLRAFTDESWVPKGESPEFAYLLGIVSTKYKGREQKNSPIFDLLSLGEKDEEVSKRIISCCEEFNIPYKHYSSGVIHLFPCRALGYIRNITKNSTVVPWEHLLSDEERKEFLAAHIDRRSGINNFKDKKDKVTTLVVFQEKYFTDKLSDLALLFADLGLYSLLNVDNGRMVFRSRSDVCRIGELAYSQTKKERLSELLRNNDAGELDISVEDCIKISEGNDDVSYAELCRSVDLFNKYGVSESDTGRIATHVRKKLKRYNALQELRKQRPNYEFISYCFRVLGFSSEESRAVSGCDSYMFLFKVINPMTSLLGRSDCMKIEPKPLLLSEPDVGYDINPNLEIDYIEDSEKADLGKIVIPFVCLHLARKVYRVPRLREEIEQEVWELGERWGNPEHDSVVDVFSYIYDRLQETRGRYKLELKDKRLIELC